MASPPSGEGNDHRVPEGESSGIAAPARDPEISVWIQQVLLQKSLCLAQDSFFFNRLCVACRSDCSVLSSCLGARMARITPNMWTWRQTPPG